jgi:hypothetical protein
MSNTPRPPLLSDEKIHSPELIIPLSKKMVRDIYEAARAKDAELIQQLFDALYAEQFVPSLGPSPLTKPAIAAAAAAGFKPTEP